MLMYGARACAGASAKPARTSKAAMHLMIFHPVYRFFSGLFVMTAS
ncbi:hypothetical protein X971_1572 [Agrobacterium tumefaciens LBA4213 (Ach5)]|jgi:hypothetical protein|nr:hypothetical protein AGROH133_06418 [Agrobacterium tumefaciens]AHK01451.1 hypothetical protein X971_1572 [Agrobacterium tumefaciens LBA4213 (Ach5)]